MEETIVLFGAGRSASCLIDYLIKWSAIKKWKLIIADASLELARSKTADSPHVTAVGLDIHEDRQRSELVSQADIVISLLPPALHAWIAKDCVRFAKNLLTASYLDSEIRSLQTDIENKGLLFLCEMGLDPGIDHMSAMQLIDGIRSKDGKIQSFRSHAGGLVAPESDDNPWHYKVSWNPANIIRAGASGALFRENGQTKKVPYTAIFDQPNRIIITELGEMAWYPNRDSLSYIPIYGLSGATTFIRTTLRHPDFCLGWKAIVDSGLTSDKEQPFPPGLTIKQWSRPLLPHLSAQTRPLMDYLGLFDEVPVHPRAQTSADILQWILEKKLLMHPKDKDMIVMIHQIEYILPGKGTDFGTSMIKVESRLIVKGEDASRTAMAKTVGLPLGIAAKLILEKKIQLKGLHIPILPEIYTPVLEELSKHDIRFSETVS